MNDQFFCDAPRARGSTGALSDKGALGTLFQTRQHDTRSGAAAAAGVGGGRSRDMTRGA